MQPVIDPAGWSPADLGDVSTWSYRITDRDTDELSDAVASIRRNGIAVEAVSREISRSRRLRMCSLMCAAS